jgi:ribosomal protein S18 acetylase RimI-like enzyme
MAAVASSRAVSDGLVIKGSRDRELLERFMSRDRLFAAYAIADMDDTEFARTRWGVAFEDAEPIAVVMEYHGLSPQPLFAMGESHAIRAILGDTIRTRIAYLAARPGVASAITDLYQVDAGASMLRMWVDRAGFTPVGGGAVRLDAADTRHLNRLYELGLTQWLPAASVASGVYYGVRRGSGLVAAAGTHVISPRYGLGAVGNVYTSREARGQGLAKQVTSAVTAELLETVGQVVLNVRADNASAIAVYKALGYREHIGFEERLVRRRLSLWDSIVTPIRRYLPTLRRNG